MKTGNGIIFQDLIILQKLLKIFMLIIPISHNLEQRIRQSKTTILKKNGESSVQETLYLHKKVM